MCYKKLILSLYLLIFVPLQAVEDNPDKKDLYVRIILIEISNHNSEKDAYDFISKVKLELKNGNVGFQNAAYCYSDDDMTSGRGGNLGRYPLDDWYPKEFNSELENLSENEVSDIIKFGDYFLVLTLNAERDLIPHSLCSTYTLNQDSSSDEICGSALNNLRYQENFLKQFPKSSKRALRSARKNYLECVENFTE